MKHHKPTDPAATVNHTTPPPRVYVRSCARPGRQSAGTCPFSPNQHKILWLWQQNLLAFPWSATNGLLTLQPWNGQIKGHKTFQKTFFCHFQWRLLHNRSTEVSSPSLKPQETRNTETTHKIILLSVGLITHDTTDSEDKTCFCKDLPSERSMPVMWPTLWFLSGRVLRPARLGWKWSVCCNLVTFICLYQGICRVLVFFKSNLRLFMTFLKTAEIKLIPYVQGRALFMILSKSVKCM